MDRYLRVPLSDLYPEGVGAFLSCIGDHRVPYGQGMCITQMDYFLPPPPTPEAKMAGFYHVCHTTLVLPF